MQTHESKETRHNKGFEAARNLESVGMPRDQAEAIVKTATSEAILIVNTHALSKEDFRHEMKGFRQELEGFRQEMRREMRQEMKQEFKDFRQELDARNYVTQEQLAVQTAYLKTEMAQLETRMGQKMTKASVWVVVILGGLTALLQGGLLVVLSQILDKL
ncbi:MAG: hypothetical protein ACR2PR_03380 [Pseudohongiellaceae bacterium]